MKLKILVTSMLSLVSVAAFAQKYELSNAKDKYDSYNVERQSKVTQAQGATDLAAAKTSIDKASLNEKTANLPLTFALKGAIYSTLALTDTVAANSKLGTQVAGTNTLQDFKIADDALAKAQALDSLKHENKDMIHSAYLNLAQVKFDEGRVEYANKKYDLAYNSFDYFRKVLPNDTTALYVTGLSAANQGYIDAKYFPYAISSYKQLIATNYSRNPEIILDLSSIYLASKDTTDAFKVISDGIAKYPNDNNLRKREIEIGLQTGKQDMLLTTVDAAIASDPKNKTLYYYSGLTYSQIAEAYNAQAKKEKDPAKKADLQQKKYDNYTKAAAQYKKAIDIDPDYFEANLNMGYVLINPAIDEYNAANKLPTNQQKQYDAAIAKSKADFAASLPYLQKAVDLNPKSIDALNNLKTYYLGTQDIPDANKTQKKIDALGAAGGGL